MPLALFQRTVVPKIANPSSSSPAPERFQFLGHFQGQVQFPSDRLQSGPPLPPELAVEPRKKFKKVKAQHAEQQPTENGHGLMARTVRQTIELGQFVEGVIFNAPALVSNGVNDLGRRT